MTHPRPRRGSGCRRLGRAAELDAEQELREDGALLVVRPQGSKGLFDLVAVYPTFVRLIQVKSFTARCGDAQRPALRQAAASLPPTCCVELWTRRAGATEFRKETF